MEVQVSEGRVILDLHPQVQAWFSTRLGGVSFPPFDTLNLSLGVGDMEPSVMENRRRMLHSVERPLQDLIMPNQVHHNHIEWVGTEHRGRGFDGRYAIDATDGLLTRDATVVLGMGFADCVPIYVTDVRARVVGILHAGWRGTVALIQQRMVQELQEMGIGPQDVLVALGPSIGPCCYEIDRPVYEAVRALVGETPLQLKDDGHWWLDLHLANRMLLEAVGVSSDHIIEAPYCTGCRRDLFFSYRVEKRVTGRMGGYICLKKPS